MKCIEVLVQNMQEELDDAEKYSVLAMEYKDKDGKLSDLYLNLSRQELDHASLQHEQGIRLTNEYKAKGNEPPAAMKAVWDWEHRKMMDQKAMILSRLSTVK